MLGFALVLAASGAIAAQAQAEKVKAAGERWLGSDQTSRELLEQTISTLLEEPQVGIDWLAAQMPAADGVPNTNRAKGLRSLRPQVVLEFLRRQQKSEWVFVGQYDPLTSLQPFAGEFLFELLLDTPDWYPFTFRVRLVPALRDLQPRPPAADRLDAVLALAADEREPLDLRRALAAMLWQWGKQENAQAFLDELQRATAEGTAEERVRTTLELADFLTLLRSYKEAAMAHRAAQLLAEDAGVTLLPIAYYAAACVHAVLGDVDRGIEALRQCARMHSSPDLDRSWRLKRVLFENDPEIELLRRDPRFPALLELAFGADDKGENAKTDRGDGR